MTKTLAWTPVPVLPAPWRRAMRRAAALALRSASGVLARAARRLREERVAPAATLPEIEFAAFHCGAGAPEGALYVDGELVAIVPGLTRL
jgi:hypothetical protein